MALVLKDRVKETTTTTGTGSFSLAGAVTGYDSFGQIGNGNTTYYAVYLDGGSEWEVGIGTYTSPSTLSRDTILASSNAGNIVTFSAGQKTIWCDYPAGKAVYTDASGNISRTIGNISAITGSISSPDYIQFDTTYTTPLGVGQLGWDGNDTLGIGMSGGNIVQEIGLQNYIYGKASSAITKGQLIKKTGSNGSSGVITFAPTTANMTDSGAIIGIAAESIALNGFGYIISTGNLRGFNTTGSSSGETWADGDTLYYNPSGNGLMTNVKPSAPNLKVEVAIVVNAGSGGSGSVAVEIIHGSVLGGTDSNVQITSPTGGQTLIYDQTDGYWKNATLTDGTAISITEGASGTITITNTGVTALSAGTGVSVSSSTGSVTVTNTAPDQTVSLAAGTGISTTGTYPSFTVTNTAPDQTVTLTAGTGISTTGTYPSFTVTNTAPDQVVSLTGTGTTSITGTYPNFTINSDDQFDGTVTSVGLTAGTGISVSGGPITSSGSITVTNTAPDQIVSIAAGTGISTSGTYPSFTVTNSAPDQTVSLTGAGTTSITGTYPNFTITSNDQYTGTVTSVATGTGLTGGPITGTGTISLANTSVTAGSYTNSTITVDAQGRITAASNGSSGGMTWAAVQTSNFTATSNNGYPINTTSAGVTVTLPASPAAGDQISLIDYAGTAATNNITINPNGKKINGITSNALIQTNREGLTLVYTDTTQGWIAVSDAMGSNVLQTYSVDYLVVAGGGGGGGRHGGGGGAGGYRTGTLTLTNGTAYTYTVTVGAGGNGGVGGDGVGSKGSNSVFSTITSAGGGGGGNDNDPTTNCDGGSGGGGSYNTTPGNGNTPSTSPSQGNNGGSGGGLYNGGGGGGAGAVGGNASSGTAGNGGNGSSSSITGSSVTYAGGGGGGGFSGDTAGTGGTGGGGAGGVSSAQPTDGTANLGGGGGGAGGNGGNAPRAGNGGSGVVIIKYPDTITLSNPGGGLTLSTTTSGGFKITSFTAGTGSIQLS